MTPPRAVAPLPILALLLALPAPVRGQEPPDTTVRPDTAAVADTLQVPPPETPSDSLRVDNLPRLPSGPPIGVATGKWAWDRQALMGERDLTVLELLERIPGLLALRGGDYGAPETATVFGFGAGRIRLFWDGFEVVPLEGGVPDLALLGLGSIEELLVERGPGELRIHITPIELREPRPFSLVEAGTGDLDTNFFRGTFLHPRAVGGTLGGMIERIDTRGTDGRETGHRLGAWLRYGFHPTETMGFTAEIRRTRRDIATTAFPVSVSRTDWTVRGRGRFVGDRVTAELFTGSSSLETGDDEPIFPVKRTRAQHGARIALDPGPVWVRGTLRLFGGPDAPSRTVELEGGAERDGLGGVYGRLGTEDWSGTDASAFTVHGWTAPFYGVSAFGSWADGVRGARVIPPFVPLPVQGDQDTEPPVGDPESEGERFTDVATMRAGASFRWRPLQVHAAWLRTEASTLPPLGLDLDRSGSVEAGGTFTGWEAGGRVELPVDGFALTGAYQTWDAEARYLPKRIYQAAIEFHDVFMETRNLEVWGALGMEGRDPMLVPDYRAKPWQEPQPALARVPFYQSWNMDIQVRILTLHAFIRWDNFTVRQRLQDFPDRRVPHTRSVYGIKWVLWN